MTKAKEALDAIQANITKHDYPASFGRASYGHLPTIQRALRILDKIESGEMKKEKPPFPENYQFAEQGINCRSHDPYGYGENGYNQCLDDLRGIE